MNKENTVNDKPAQTPADPLAKLREPFPAHQISKLPKPTKVQTEAVKADYKKGIRCGICGSWHHPDVVHLDYVGHAALTDRLLDADPHWLWEPVAFRDGLPAFDNTGGLWIKLTVCGVSRLGYGHAAGKPGADPGAREKEVIGDALRNAAMRFGAALDLWHKGDLHVSDEAEEPPRRQAPREEPHESAAVQAAGVAIDLCGSEAVLLKWAADNKRGIEDMSDADQAEVRRRYGRRLKTLRAEADANRKAHESDNIAYGEDPFEEAA